MLRRILLACPAMLLAVVAFGQKGGGTNGGGGNRNPTSGTPTTTNSPTTIPTTPSQTPSQQRPIFISGRVVIEGGDAPPERVSIERVCTGATYREGYTDSKGYFSFQLGSNNTVFADASMETPGMFGGSMNTQQNGVSSMSQGNNTTSLGFDLASCELRATLNGYHSDSVPLINRRSLDNPDIGVIILTPMMKVDGLTTSATVALAPKDVKKAFEKGLNFEKHLKPDEAQTEFLHVVELYPKHAGAWIELGKLYEQRNHFDEARDAYKRAIAADVNFVNPYERLYLLDMRDGKWGDAAEVSAKVIHLNPYEFPAAFYYNALANINLQKWDDAEKSAREASKVRGTKAMPKSLFLLGLAQANKGDLPGAIDTINGYLKTEPAAQDKDRAQKLLGQIQENLAAQNPGAKTPPQ